MTIEAYSLPSLSSFHYIMITDFLMQRIRIENDILSNQSLLFLGLSVTGVTYYLFTIERSTKVHGYVLQNMTTTVYKYKDPGSKLFTNSKSHFMQRV